MLYIIDIRIRMSSEIRNDSRDLIISNLRRDTLSDTNNDITVSLPDGIFSGKIEAVNLKHLSIDYDVETIGTSNNTFSIAYPSTAAYTTITLNINYYLSSVIKSDEDIADAIASAINTSLGTTVFNVFFSNEIVYAHNVYRDNSNLTSNYTIFTSNGVQFGLDFSGKTSIGPLIGFGNNQYIGSSSYTGGNIPPVGAYECIKIANGAYNPSLKLFDQYTDLNCKFDLYDENGARISNYTDARDATISLPLNNDYVFSVSDLISLVETEMNMYSSSFKNAVFSVKFDYQTHKFTFSTNKDIVFGIGFRLDQGNGSNNYGSMHRILGFNKRVYLGLTSISSIKPAAIFSKSYLSEYVMIYSDLIKNNFDTSIIVPGNNDSSSMYEALFVIPTALIQNGSYKPSNRQDHRVRIHASKLAKLYNENIDKAKTINFYLRLSSGRHVKLNTQWFMQLEIEYSN